MTLEEVTRMQDVQLGNTGLKVSRLAFGTVYLGPLSDRFSPEDGAALLLQALDRGIAFWDTSVITAPIRTWPTPCVRYPASRW